MKNVFILCTMCFMLSLLFSCGSGGSSGYTYKQNNLDFDAYWTFQGIEDKATEKRALVCGVACVHMWLKWLNKNPGYPSIEQFENWAKMTKSDYGDGDDYYGDKFYEDEIGIFESLTMFSDAMYQLVTWTSNHITLNIKSILVYSSVSVDESDFTRFLKVVRDSVNDQKQPVMLFMNWYEQDTSPKGAHGVMVRGYEYDKNDPTNVDKFRKLYLSNGYKTDTKNQAVSMSELKRWGPNGFAFTNKVTYTYSSTSSNKINNNNTKWTNKPIGINPKGMMKF